jgi:hypothetical protein
MRLTKLERNEIYQAIEGSELDPAECDLEILDDKAVIRHRSGSTVYIRRIQPSSSPKIQPSPSPKFRYIFSFHIIDRNRRRTKRVLNIFSALPDIQRWANEVRWESEIPDLWEQMRRSRELITDIQKPNSSNAHFTRDEQGRITAQVHEITKQLKEQFELTREQAEAIDEWRDEVVEASKRMGRKDWFIYVLGAITALTIAATVPAGLGEHVITMVIHALGYMFTGGHEPPQVLS